MSQSKPEIAEALGMKNARIIGGQVVGKLRFESGQHERDYLTEAGDSFCFPLMERRLMLTGAGNALRCAEDLALKSYVAARCASRLLNAEREQPLRIASLEQKVSGLEEEKAALEAELSTSRASAETELQAARRETEAAKVEMAELRWSLEANERELKDAECREQAATQAINAYREVVRAGAEPLQLEIAAFLKIMGLSAPDLSPTANTISISELFRWLRACLHGHLR